MSAAQCPNIIRSSSEKSHTGTPKMRHLQGESFPRLALCKACSRCSIAGRTSTARLNRGLSVVKYVSDNQLDIERFIRDAFRVRRWQLCVMQSCQLPRRRRSDEERGFHRHLHDRRGLARRIIIPYESDIREIALDGPCGVHVYRVRRQARSVLLSTPAK